MHRIDTPTAQIDKFGVGKNGFTAGNPQTGELPTALDQDFFDSLQEEVSAVIEASGGILNKSLRNQLLVAIKRLSLIKNVNFFTGTGTANAILISPEPAITSLNDGQVFEIACAATNTGAVTLKVNALAAYAVNGSAGALQGGEIVAGKGIIRVVWQASTNTFLLLAQNTTGPFQVAKATKSNQAPQLSQVLQLENYLSEIEAAGAAAQGAARLSLKLGDAALAGVGNGPAQIPSMAHFTSLLAQNGWQKLPSGLIIQWGAGNYTDNLSVSLPIPFPAKFSAITISSNPADTVRPEITQAYPSGTSAFIAGCSAWNGTNFVAAQLNCTWIAIGY